ncbi:hypothetical protein WG904_11610 [Pedobacter sp. Du54]|uniref:hypothetical protein n=1 Tax=Pedobacter anseongensis TaxID=3133439 RepID=UPI0030A92C95
MLLIAQHKILDYIKKHPESRVALLLWLRSYPSRPFVGMDQPHQLYRSWPRSHGTASSDGYQIEYQINLSAKVQLITWVGSVAEHEEKFRFEVEAIENYYQERGIALEKFSSTSFFTLKGRKTHKRGKTVNLLNTAPKDKLKAFNVDVTLADFNYFATKEEYELGLQNAIKLFNSIPNEKDFVDFSTLLLKIDQYERNQLEWPKAEYYEFVKLRMNLFKLTTFDFRDIIPNETDVELYLAGKLTFKSSLLKRIYTRVGLNFL